MLKRKPSNASDKEKHQKPKRSSSFGNFDRFRNNSVSKSDDSIEKPSTNSSSFSQSSTKWQAFYLVLQSIVAMGDGNACFLMPTKK